jgi:hypothetical protein
MAIRMDKEEVVLTSIGMEIIGLYHVIFLETIFRTFKYQQIVVVENVSKLQDALTLYGQHIWVGLVG